MGESNFDSMAAFAMGMDSGRNCGGYMGGYGGYGGYGGMNDWMGLAMFALIFGRNGGVFGNNDGNCATQADVRAAVDQQTLISKLDQQTYGLADATYALNNTIVNGFHGVDNAVCNLGFNVQQGFNSIGHQISDCCCTTQRAIDGVRYDMATQACDTRRAIADAARDITDNANANYRSMMDFMVQSKIDKLQSENEALRLKASQADQNAVLRAAIDASTAEIIRRTGNECPIPAYVVPNPNCCYGNPLGVSYGNGWGSGFGRDGSCGCGC